MKEIIVLTDFSYQSSHAFQLAYQLAVQSHNPITLLHIVEPETEESYEFKSEHVEGEEPGHINQLLRIAHEKLESIIADPEYTRAELSYQVSLGYGKEIGDILEKGVDLIVMGQRHAITMGTRGASAEREMHLGMYLEKFIRQAECPVLMVKEFFPDSSLQNIVLASAFGESFPEVLVNKVKDFASSFNAIIHLLWVKTPDNFQEYNPEASSLGQLARQNGIENYTTYLYEAQTIEAGIIDYSEAIGADLLALALPCQVGLPELLSGSVAEEIINQLGKPVLSICL